MADTHKTQDYYDMLSQLVHELHDSSPGDLYSARYNPVIAYHINLKYCIAHSGYIKACTREGACF